MYRHAPTQSGASPFYSDFGNNIYASDIVVQSIRCKANEFKKLMPRHIVTENGTQNVITDSSVAKILSRPNELMTTADFLEKITILLELNKNVFIYPTYYTSKAGKRVYTGLYPLKPSQVTYMVDDVGVYYLRMQFASGYETTLPLADVIHWRKDYGVDDFFGGSMCGGNDNAGLLTMLQRYDMLLQSLSKALECSCQINGIVRLNTYSNTDAMDAEKQRFESQLRNNESGVLFTDNAAEYTAIPRDIKLVDSETLKVVYEMILRANGTSLAILNGDYTKTQKEAYYEHALEADIKSLGQAMSRVLFSDRETSFGNEVILYPNEIVFMSMENKLSALNIGLPAGLFTKDEARELLGYAPLPDGAGQFIPQGYNSLLGEANKNKLTSEQTVDVDDGGIKDEQV